MPRRHLTRCYMLDHFLHRLHDNFMLIYKIFRADEWAVLQRNGRTAGAPVDLADGYIHFSTADTVGETTVKYFAGETGLVLLAVDADKLDALKWEPARGGVLFPHLYRDLTLADVVWARDLPLVNGTHVMPDLA